MNQEQVREGRTCGTSGAIPLAAGLLVLALIPAQAFACNMIHGQILNVFRFRPITMVPFCINMAVIVLLESVALRFFTPIRSYWKALTQAAILNVVSALVIFLVFLATGNPFHSAHDWNVSTYMSFWGQFIVPELWLLPMSLAAEFPLLWLLCRKLHVSWKRLLLALAVANVASIAVLCLFEPAMLRVWYKQLERMDAELRAQWRSPALLKEAGGRIYSLSEEQLDEDGAKAERRYAGLTVDGGYMPSGPLGYRLRYFDLTDGEWHSVTNSPPLRPGLWSLTSNRLAFLVTNSVRVVEFPSMTPLSTVRLEDHTHAPLRVIALAPDGSKLALSTVDSGLSRKAGGSDVRRFTRNRVLLFAVGSGAMIAECSRWALDGPLFWTPDSSKVLFRSTIDAKELEQGVIPLDRFRESTGGRLHYGIAPKLPQELFAFDTESGDVNLLRTGLSPVSQCGNTLLSAKYSLFRLPRLELLDIDTGDHRAIPIKGLGGWNHLVQLSPDGRFLCAETRLAWYTCHAIIDLRDTNRRHIVSERPLIARPVHAMHFVWLPEQPVNHKDREHPTR